MNQIGSVKRHVPGYFFARHIRHLLFPKEIEYRLLARNLARYDLFVDVGANLGYYSYLFARSRSLVLAFEPNPHLSEYLQAIFGNRVRVINAAASSAQTRKPLFVPKGELSSGRSSLQAGNVRRYTEDLVVEEVETVPLDTVLLPFQTGHDRIFIKIDVEGHEMAVLEGGRRLLQSDAMVDLMVEIDPSHNTGWEGVFEFMRRQGYEAYYFDDRVLPLRTEHLVPKLAVERHARRPGPVDNFLFSREDLSRALV